jgi:DNA-binding MarR family transcriptional regulator
MTRIIGVLEEGGYVMRETDPADRRSCLIALTPQGAEVLAGTHNARAGRLARHLADLDPRQRAALVAALPALEALAEVESTVDSK